MRPGPLICALLLALAATPAPAQRTLHVPQEQIDALPDVTMPEFDIDLGSPEGILRSMESIAGADWIGTLPEAIAEAIIGTPLLQAQAPVVWETRATGAWSLTQSGTGTVSVIDLGAMGGAGSQVHALLHSPDRDWPLSVAAQVSALDEAVARLRFSGTGEGAAVGGTGIGAATNHLFQPRRRVGHATDEGMRSPEFLPMLPDFLYTQVEGGRVQVDARDGRIRMAFEARVVEYDRRSSAPTGRSARLTGWLCETALHGVDPDGCAIPDEELELLAVTPENLRENVNYRTPGIGLTFSEPVDTDSLRAAFRLFTWSPDLTRMEIAGRFEPRGEAQYAFLPDTELPDGAILEAELAGGADGVRSRDGEAHLKDGLRWRFSTMIASVATRAEGAQLSGLDAYQTLRNAPLVMGKPSLLRLAPRWTGNPGVHPDWQVQSFAATLAGNAQPVRLAGQFDTAPGAEGEIRIHQHEIFSDAQRTRVEDTVNLFGWVPQWEGPDSAVVLTITPHDPWPEPLEDAVWTVEGSFANWPVEPSRLTIRYAYFEAGAWADGVPPADRARAEAVLRGAEIYATQLFPVLGTRFTPILLPGVEATIDPAFLELGIDDSSPAVQAALEREAATSLTRPALRGGGYRLGALIRRASLRLRWILSQAGQGNEMILLLYPGDIGGEGMVTDVGFFFDPHDHARGIGMPIYDGMPVEPLAMGLVHELGHALGLHHIPAHASVVEARGLLPWDHRDPGMEGFRLAPDGSHGWLKSHTHGNAEAVSVLAPLMWPQVMPTTWAWISEGEYTDLRARFANRAGARRLGAAFAPGAPVQLASAGPGSLVLPPEDPPGTEPARKIALSGVIHPHGTAATIAHVGRTERPRSAPPGPYTAALLDADGATLHARTFDTERPPPPFPVGYHRFRRAVERPEAGSTTPTGEDAAQSQVGAGASSELLPGAVMRRPDQDRPAPTDPGLWPDFALTLPDHPDAVRIVISLGHEVLAELAGPAAPPTLRPHAEVLDLTGGPARLNWTLGGRAPLVDLQYSPDGETGWTVLLAGRLATGARIDPADLPPGPSPTLRLVARDGLAEAERRLPVLMDRPPLPVATTATPLTAQFDTPLAADAPAHVHLAGPDGTELGARVVLSPDGRFLSVWPDHPLEPDAPHSLRLAPGLSDRAGNKLSTSWEWSFVSDP